MAIGAARHRVTVVEPVTSPDGEGGTIVVWTPLPPDWDMSVRPSNVRDLERAAVSTIVAAATHIAEGRYRADVTIKMRLHFDLRVFEITGLKNVDERRITMQLFLVERLA